MGKIEALHKREIFTVKKKFHICTTIISIPIVKNLYFPSTSLTLLTSTELIFRVVNDHIKNEKKKKHNITSFYTTLYGEKHEVFTAEPIYSTVKTHLSHNKSWKKIKYKNNMSM